MRTTEIVCIQLADPITQLHSLTSDLYQLCYNLATGALISFLFHILCVSIILMMSCRLLMMMNNEFVSIILCVSIILYPSTVICIHYIDDTCMMMTSCRLLMLMSNELKYLDKAYAYLRIGNKYGETQWAFTFILTYTYTLTYLLYYRCTTSKWRVA